MKQFRKWLEYAGFSFATATIPRLSRSGLLRLADFLAKLGYTVAPELRKVGRANLDLVYGDEKTPEEKTTILKTSFKTFILAMLDSLWFTRDTKNRIQKWVRHDPSLSDFFQDKPFVCLTGHFGNWEVLGIMTALHGHPLVSVYKPLKNERVDKKFRWMRTHTGQEIVETGGAFRKLIRELKRGKKIGLVIDQNTRADQGGSFFDFLGTPALVSTAPAALAIMTKTSVYAGFCRPHSDGSYQVFSPTREIHLDPYLDRGEEGILDLTRKLITTIEETIKKEPEIWLWMYKRWKYIPEGANPADFPYYAKGIKMPSPERAEKEEKREAVS